MQASIIIPYFNASATITYCVEAIKKQMGPDDELIIVNDGSSTSDAKKLDSIEGCNIVEHQENKGAATARNSGMKVARHNMLVFVDADVCLEENCLSSIKKVLADEAEACFIVPDRGRQESFFSDYKNLYMRAVLTKNDDDINYIYGSCCAIRGDLSEISWPSELSLIEDNIWGHKLWNSGAKIKRICHASFIHKKKYSIYSLVKNDFLVARQFAKFMVREKRWETLYGHKKFGHTSKSQKASVVLAVLSFLTVIPAPALCLVLFIFWGALNISFFRYLGKERGVGFVVASILWTYITHLVYFLGIMSGYFDELLTTLRGHREKVERS